MSYLNEHLQIRYAGRFVFSTFPREHASWCHLTVIQGPQKAMVLLTKEEDNRGTFIANAAELLATQVTNLFTLDPPSTMFFERTPPVDRAQEMRQFDSEITPSHHRLLPVSLLFGTSEDHYERIFLT